MLTLTEQIRRVSRILGLSATAASLCDCICLHAFDWRAPTQSTHKQLTQTIFTLHGALDATLTHIFHSHISCPFLLLFKKYFWKGGLRHLSRTFSMLMAVLVCYVTFSV